MDHMDPDRVSARVSGRLYTPQRRRCFYNEGRVDDLDEGVLVDSFAPGERRREKV